MQRMVRYSFTTAALTGTGTISVQIPGTFTGMQRAASGSNGRIIVAAHAFFKNPTAGDYLSNFQVLDNDGVIPVGARGAFPNYPVISAWADPGVSAGNVGVYLDPNGPTLLTPLDNNAFAPSGLYLTGTIQKNSIGADTLLLNITWEDLT